MQQYQDKGRSCEIYFNSKAEFRQYLKRYSRTYATLCNNVRVKVEAMQYILREKQNLCNILKGKAAFMQHCATMSG